MAFQQRRRVEAVRLTQSSVGTQQSQDLTGIIQSAEHREQVGAAAWARH